jgi:hypothetical protein
LVWYGLGFQLVNRTASWIVSHSMNAAGSA